MSKKHKKLGFHSGFQAGGASLSHEQEYRIIKVDLIKVVIVNAVYLAAILFLYFANRQSHILDNWFSRILHF